MKNFIVAVCLLVLTLAFTVANAAAVQKQVSVLTDCAMRDDVHALEDALDKLDPYLSLSVPHMILESLHESAAAMRVYFDSGDPSMQTEYLTAREKFLLYCKEITDGEKFSVSNLF